MAERYTRLSQKQVLRGLRVRIPLSAPHNKKGTSQARQEANLRRFQFYENFNLRQILPQLTNLLIHLTDCALLQTWEHGQVEISIIIAMLLDTSISYTILLR